MEWSATGVPMPESSPKKAMDHKGSFWIHYTNLLEMSQAKKLESMRRMIKYGWAAIPTEWRKGERNKEMNKLEEEYKDQTRDPDDILADMIQLMSDTALECGLIDKKRHFYV